MKQSVVQGDEFGCSAACVAFVLNQDYADIAGFLGIEKARTKGFYCQELVDALGAYGLIYGYRYVRPGLLKSLTRQNGSIVFIRRSERYPAGHYLTRWNGYWHDPWINFGRDKDIKRTIAGFRRRLPGRVQYVLYRCE